MAILSIQSQVLNGAVGNSGAAFILARLGHEVWPLPTVLLSHHPGHGGAEGGPVKPARLAALVAGLAARGAFARCEAVVSGYLGVEAAVPVVEDAVARARAAHPGALYVCDPVIGDHGRAYVPSALIAAIRDRLVPRADILLPNAFELGVLAGSPPSDRRSAFAAMAALGPKAVILTGFCGADTPPDMLDILALDGDGPRQIAVPQLAGRFSGAGDAFAALFLAHYLPVRRLDKALAAASASMTALLRATLRHGADELAIVAGQQAWIAAAQDGES
ncbi:MULTISPECIES: pyridoxal kinase [unclassified Acidiphilium]|uniref:pyridoxal kinase n=1 Tax=unclassified Acidiphilium TaxID=2617493 RepID=UPI000BDA3515|nr:MULTISPECIES: pyridoxal kinase [unclassified Acidiphilium]OYV55022.1 MAG: pyridoxal kinase [Acidiphilium sp. 20-67-58]HQT62222.1 pyridoxal kinase [Acidiphilium sp.]